MTSDRAPAPHAPGRAGPVLATVVVGDDGGPGGRAALALARALAPGARLLLASAYPSERQPHTGALAAYEEALHRDAEDRLARTRDAAGVDPGAVALVALGDRSPARALHELAEREAADLIVAGSSHRGRVGRIFLGSVGRDLLHGAPCPVAVAPHERPVAAVSTIGVAYDGGPEAHAALKLAASLARERDGRLVVRSVVESTMLPSIAGFAFEVQELFDELTQEAQETVERAVADLGVPVDARASVGIVQDEVERLAHDVDLLVCGSRGWGALRRVVLGSTADRLIHHATCPVLVVPRPADAGDEGAERHRATARETA